MGASPAAKGAAAAATTTATAKTATRGEPTAGLLADLQEGEGEGLLSLPGVAKTPEPRGKGLASSGLAAARSIRWGKKREGERRNAPGVFPHYACTSY
jgi:hypothetical protein